MCSYAQLQEAALMQSGTLGAGQGETCEVERDWDNIELDDLYDPDEQRCSMDGFEWEDEPTC